jgi:AraC family transcriptional regulator
MPSHPGPYDRRGETYARLCGQWASHSGYELRSAPCLEEYLNGPEWTEPEDLVTDVFVPLASRGRRQMRIA